VNEYSMGGTVAFSKVFEQWLQEALQPGVPQEVQAFSFNLFEPAGQKGVKFGIELIGAGRFAPDDQDWACDEVWEPAQRGLAIPVSFSGENWERCLERVRGLLQPVLQRGDGPSAVLKSRRAVGLGFVDGELEIV
jgi:hypothetical protein